MLTATGIGTLILSMLGAFGGAAVVGGLVAKYVSDHASKQWLQTHKGQLDQVLETHKAELTRDTETHKLSLKRQELLFNREIEAADALMKLYRRIYPDYSRPDMEWHDACEDVADRLGQVETDLEDYLELHSAVISGPVREKIEAIRSQAASEKFFTSDVPDDVPNHALEAAGQILEGLNEARAHMLQDIRR
ncbi:MAG TPA: hypothetical protein VEB68_03210 [Croceibacterium sp.]|nr:hypothetical protein [Croceibacterium sp.]